MHFQAAFTYCKHGKPITLPEWGGYWRWDEARKTLVMHTRTGAEIDIRSSKDMDYTLAFIFRDDWQLVDDVRDTEHYAAKQKAAEPPRWDPSKTSWGQLKTDYPPAQECLICHGHHSPGLPCPEMQAWSKT